MTATSDSTQAPVRRWFEELFNEGDVSVAGEILAEDVEYSGPSSLSPGEATGIEPIEEFVEVYNAAFPDLLYEIDAISEADGEVRVRWTATGTHESDLFGIDSTGNVFTVEGIDVFVVEDGLITAVYAQWDTLKLLQELGVVPSVDSM